MQVYSLRYGRRWINALFLRRKQIHQLELKLLGDIAGFKWGDTVSLNLNTLDMTLLSREDA